MTLLQKIKCTEGVTVLRKTRRSIKPSSHASMQKSRDNEWCVGKQKSNKSTRDQNGAGERKRDKKCSIQEASIAHALCTCFLLRHRFAMDFFSLRAHYIPACRSSVWAFFVRPVAKSTPHKYWAHIECV